MQPLIIPPEIMRHLREGHNYHLDGNTLTFWVYDSDTMDDIEHEYEVKEGEK